MVPQKSKNRKSWKYQCLVGAQSRKLLKKLNWSALSWVTSSLALSGVASSVASSGVLCCFVLGHFFGCFVLGRFFGCFCRGSFR